MSLSAATLSRDLKRIAARLKSRILVNSAPAKAWRNILWPHATAADGLHAIYCQQYDVLGANRVEMICDERVRECFAEQDDRWRFQQDIVYRIDGDVTIEPRFSLAYLPGRRLVDPVRGVHQEIVPSLLGIGIRRAFGAPAQHFEALIHFDGFLGTNAWHFFADAFNAMFLLDGIGIVPADIPILIHRRIWNNPLARLVLDRPPFSSRRWIVQDENCWIRTSRLYKALCTLGHFREAHAFLGSFVEKKPHRRIFLNRRPRYGRLVSNIEEIEPILKSHGFETVFCEDLPFEDQVRLFSEVRDIVGIHGAGLTNLMFSDIPSVRCLELIPQDYPHAHYYWLLQLVGARKYDAILGSEFDYALRFRVDPVRFRQQLEALLS